MRRAELPALVATLLLAGCALPGLRAEAGASRPLFRDPAMSVDAAARAIPIGSDRQLVQARLGPAETLSFDSGYEVWVYRARGRSEGGDGPELVLLFDPSGRVGKLRVKPDYRGRPTP